MTRFIAIAALVAATSTGIAHAEPSVTVTVDGVDYPICYVEDCSDQPGQVGVWTNAEGQSYLELGESITLPIAGGAR